MPRQFFAVAEAMILEKAIAKGFQFSRKSQAGMLLLGLSLLLALVATGFLIVAFHLWVQTQYTPDQAALMTGGVMLALSLVAGCVALSVMHHRRLRARAIKKDIKENIQAAIDALDSELGEQIRDNPRTAVALASIAGFILAEKIL